MAVNLPELSAADLSPVRGVALGVSEANIRKPNRRDLLVIALEQGTKVAGVFTRNRFCAAPVVLARQRLRSPLRPRALLINTGCANAGTGEDGLNRARETCAALARILGCAPEEVLPFSTGVIMESLPVERMIAELPRCVSDLKEDNWLAAAQAIMTTDTLPKGVSKRLYMDEAEVTITGIAKGAGMIHPNLATMLAFIASDANLSQPLLETALREAARRSFNRISVDGDTSTNDALIVIASGRAAGLPVSDAASPQFLAFRQALEEVAARLAQAIVRDGEGATKLITVQVDGGATEAECEQVAFAIARSPLVKTAFFASDPNLGRILAAIGNSGIDDLDIGRLRLYLQDVLVAENAAASSRYTEQQGREAMRENEIMVRVELGRGSASAAVSTCDLSYDYVKINAEYRS